MDMTSNVEEYLEAIYKLQLKERPVRVSRIAESLGLSRASVTEMTKRLDADGLVERSEGVGVELTDAGRDAALALVRKHRLAERFLTDVLGIPWDKVHEEACLYEHVLSDEVECGLDELLERPGTCPHGFPIPDRSGAVEEMNTVQLSTLPAGSKATIAAVEEDDASMLSYLACLGIMPGIGIEVLEIAPFSGPMLVQVKGARYAIGPEVAGKVHVTLAETSRGRGSGKSKVLQGSALKKERAGR